MHPSVMTIPAVVVRLTGHRPLPFFAAEREQRQDVRFLP